MPRRNEITTAALLACIAVLLVGCRPKSEMDGRRYRHNGMHFALEVPVGWKIEELDGDVLVELKGPADGAGSHRPMVHVYSRATRPVDLAAECDALAELARDELKLRAPELIDQGAEPPPVESEPAQVGGLAGRRIVRPVKAGAVQMEQELLLAARGRHVWALMITVPPDAAGADAEAVAEIKRTFEVW